MNHDTMESNRPDYGQQFGPLTAEVRLEPLGPGKPNEKAAEVFGRISVKTAFDGVAVADNAMAQAGVWLYHGYLDESHLLCQSIDTPTGSYWYGIMHRREPDASNAAYWFGRVGDHQIFGALTTSSASLAAEMGTDDEPNFLRDQVH